MKLNYLLFSGIAALAFTASVTAEPVRYESVPSGSEMKIDGKATGKTWHSVGKIIVGSFEADSAWLKDPTTKGAPKCELNIPIRTLKSQAAAGAGTMDKRMQLEMKADKFPRIEYKLTELAVKGAVPASGSPVTFDAKGDLALSGVTNKVTFPVTLERVDANTLKWTGTYTTKMTAFGIKPPEFKLLGIGLETADEVTLSWTWVTALKAAEAK